MRKKLLTDDILNNYVLFPNETLIWFENAGTPMREKIKIASYIIGSIGFFIVALLVPYHSEGEFRNRSLIALIPLAVGLLAGGWSIWEEVANRYYVVTDQRVFTCHIKRGHFARTVEIPINYVDSIDILPKNTIAFHSHYQKSSVIRFENVNDIEELERIFRNHLVQQIQLESSEKVNEVRDRTNSFVRVELEDSNLTLESSNLAYTGQSRVISQEISNWSYPYQRMVHVALPQLSVTESATMIAHEHEPVIWTYSPSTISIITWPLILFFTELIFLISFSIVVSSGALFGVGLLLILILLFYIIMVHTGYKQAYAMTAKDLLVIISGIKMGKELPEGHYQYDDGFLLHAIKIKHQSLFPLFSDMNLKSGQGMVILSNGGLMLPLHNVREFLQVLHSNLKKKENI